ncbi:C-N hydrolase family amidase [Roseovarius sp. THAF8]|uniref:carbon-nitrogen hydrolase family protein n=1 Tax=Roseovarius sp. THAF8 TaxID=2587846 RepID=UPI00126800A4|nr:carbon-nitrogen hydrolase family protein [Roseovarius sp. THAF8]QFT98933.1 C-N hydrolase family amidase [Roseovarius sp. THAF8]
MKIATAAYPLDEFDSWDAYAEKIEAWVAEAAGRGADLLVFPEYAAMELAPLAGRAVSAELEPSLRAVSERMPEADALHSTLAGKYGVHILGGSAPVYDDAIGPRPVNRAAFFGPGGGKGVVDKQIMTRWEREPMACVGGGPLKVFDTALGRVGVLICYDSEFPLLGRAMQDVDILLVPSCTETLAGYWRVRIGAMARALEQQCVSAMSSLVGPADWCEVCDVNTGAGGVFGPPDIGFPPTGVLAAGELDAPGWTYAEADLKKIAQVRADGGVLNRTHWAEQAGRDGAPTVERLQ